MKYPNYKSLDDCQLIAWHHMLNDPILSTYVMYQGKNGTWYEVRKWANPKLAWQRNMLTLADGINRMSNAIMKALFGPMFDLGEAMKNMVKSFEQSGLMSSLTDAEGLE